MLGQKEFVDFAYGVTLNTVGDLEEYACNSETNLKYDEMVYNTIAYENEKQLNCSVPFHPPTTSKLTQGIIEICNNSESGAKAYANFKSYTRSGPQETKNKPCATMDFLLGIPHVVGKAKKMNSGYDAYIRLYINSNVKVYSIIMYYDFTTLAAEIGGYIGMCMGISLVDFTILCNNALFKMVTERFKRKNEQILPIINMRH